MVSQKYLAPWTLIEKLDELNAGPYKVADNESNWGESF
jgi:hypothetical protein